ncbi:hypothetical protein [Cohnella sp. JJ-181]|uniref:hypothetical protein n=1 Tax=Cohnella rhizoplanae TaxID=2974897 RepID=UPI0022FF50C2|nr:hypothetical protein [Cohnella sp. JJ-181]CAI6086434.1 hypothetical protein COHCIP112018_05027 [Cohnella sp. JJ-181]
MDIRKKAEEIVSRVKNDKDFSDKFRRDPAAAIETVIGVNLPNDRLNALIAGVKAKLATDKAGDLLGSFKKLF